MLKIFQRNQSVQVLARVDGPRTVELATIVNSPHGWIARRHPDDNGVNVSRLVNQHTGAEQIAAALGL